MESEINFIKLIISVPAGIEPATLRLTAARSNQLSYKTLCYYLLYSIIKNGLSKN